MTASAAEKGRPWTPTEVDTLRAEYGVARSCDIAARLGRTVAAVRVKARKKLGLKSGLMHAGRPGWVSGYDALLVEMNRAGATDPEIAARVGRHPCTVRTRRKALGRPTADAALAESFGLHFGFRPPLVRIVLALLDRPMTRPEVIAAAGRDACLPQNTTRLLSHLRRIGVVARVGPSPSCSRPLYTLTPQALDLIAAAGRTEAANGVA